MKTSEETLEDLYEQIDDMKCVAVPPGTVYEMTLSMWVVEALLDDSHRGTEMERELGLLNATAESACADADAAKGALAMDKIKRLRAELQMTAAMCDMVNKGWARMKVSDDAKMTFQLTEAGTKEGVALRNTCEGHGVPYSECGCPRDQFDAYGSLYDNVG